MKRLLVALIAAVVLAFAIQGGEYGTTDLLRQRARKRATEADIRSLEREVDSLRLWKRALTSDPAVQERIAREEFGMVRGDKEILYRFSDSPSDSGSDSGRRRGFGRAAGGANRRP